MPTVQNSRIVPFPLANIYAIVMDIEHYPQLLSFIRDVKILKRDDNALVARVFVGFPVLTFSYDCHVEFGLNDFIKITLISGPFRKLNASWRFFKISENETRIDYSLDSEFRNPLAEFTAGAVFAAQLDHAIDVFTARLHRS